MDVRKRARLGVVIFALLSLLLAGCGGGDDGIFSGFDTDAQQFWAFDYRAAAAEPTYYRVTARRKVAGQYCFIYVEAGAEISSAVLQNIANEFDTRIYPSVKEAFGDEPSPGIDGDSRVHILLLDIRDGYVPQSGGGYVGGYFDSTNQFLQSYLDIYDTRYKSNEKEILLVDINPQQPGSTGFYRTIAHEFQHMIHWQQKDSRLETEDDTWLNEAMAEAAPLYCNYGIDNGRIATFALAPSDPLTTWNSRLEDYAVAYMWAQYIKDRLPATLFRTALQNPLTGVASIEDALDNVGAGKTFTETFRDWTVANLVASDNARLRGAVEAAGHPEWTYASPALILPSLTDGAHSNATTLEPLGPWSAGYYRYSYGGDASGTIRWTRPGGSLANAFFISTGDNAITPAVEPGLDYPFLVSGYLIVRNASGADNTATGTVAPAASASLLAAGAVPLRVAAPQGVSSNPAATAPRPVTGGMICGTHRPHLQGTGAPTQGLRLRVR